MESGLLMYCIYLICVQINEDLHKLESKIGLLLNETEKEQSEEKEC